MKKTIIRPVGLPGTISTQVATPIMPSVVYASKDPNELDKQYEDKEKGYTYAREGHPNAEILASLVNKMEDAPSGLIVSSGMAAITALTMGLFSKGDHILGGDQLYGRSIRLMTEDLPRFGIETSFADPTNIISMENAIRSNTKLILIEAVSNPTLRVADIQGISDLCKRNKILFAVDNTFTTPLSVKPFQLGADFVLHSITKLLAGHSDVTLGYISAKDISHSKEIYNFAVSTGMTPSPFDCWLAERGMITFPLRFKKSQETAASLANFLNTNDKVVRTLYPILENHPDINRACEILGRNGCNMVSFEIEGGRDAANKFISDIEGVSFAPTLGDVGTTISHPASSSHRYLSPEARKNLGISEGFFRVSVGLEEDKELIDIFKEALGNQ
jgi:cystathionine gamma-synthase